MDGEGDSEFVVHVDAEYDGDGVFDIDFAGDDDLVKKILEDGVRVQCIEAVGDSDCVLLVAAVKLCCCPVGVAPIVDPCDKDGAFVALLFNVVLTDIVIEGVTEEESEGFCEPDTVLVTTILWLPVTDDALVPVCPTME